MGKRLAAFVLLAALAVPALAGAQATTPSARTLYHDGPDGRYLMDGPWLYRADPGDEGLNQGLPSLTSTAGWSQVSVPSAWNTGDVSQASFDGSIGWYRKDFKLADPDASLDWVLRFESVNYHADVYLNGDKIGDHTGGYVPFEIPAAKLSRTGVNRLVMRVDNRRNGKARGVTGQPPDGWWNYGGPLREVYLRKIDRVDLAPQVTTTIACPTCSATVDVRVTAVNASPDDQLVHLVGRFGTTKLDFGTLSVAGLDSVVFRRTLRIARPRPWSPLSPYLYGLRLTAGAAPLATPTAKMTRAAGYSLRVGIRQIKVGGDGTLLLNGVPLHMRGVFVHEDDPNLGAALDNRARANLVAEARAAGASILRSHYPFHPQILELADKYGLLVWSEVPVYRLTEKQIGNPSMQKLALTELHDNIVANRNHASILTWSMGNELDMSVSQPQARYLIAASQLIHNLDSTRPAALAVVANPGPCIEAYAPVQIMGINEYFGWYAGDGSTADRDQLSGFLDSQRACYPKKALMVTEFGAESNRDGPAEEKGTYGYQDGYVRFSLGVMDTKPWLAAAIYFALREFRIYPGWAGGNPIAGAPLHQKGLITFAGVPKPAFYDLSANFRATAQYGTRRLVRR